MHIEIGYRGEDLEITPSSVRSRRTKSKVPEAVKRRLATAFEDSFEGVSFRQFLFNGQYFDIVGNPFQPTFYREGERVGAFTHGQETIEDGQGFLMDQYSFCLGPVLSGNYPKDSGSGETAH